MTTDRVLSVIFICCLVGAAGSYVMALFLRRKSGTPSQHTPGTRPSFRDALSSTSRTMTNINLSILIKSYTQAIVYLIAFVIIIAIIVMVVLFAIHIYM